MNWDKLSNFTYTFIGGLIYYTINIKNEIISMIKNKNET